MEAVIESNSATGLARTPAQELITQLGAVREHLTTCFPEREEAVDCILTGAVAGEHVLMLGVPGTGKSALAREFSRCIGGSFYEYLFNKFTTPEEFLGPFSIKGLKADKYERVLKGRLAECDVAFLDEVFKSNSASLNTLLPILNERIVFQGGGAQPIPLRIAVAASNELPTDPSLQALWDRIILRCFVHPLHGDQARESVMLGETKPSGNRPKIEQRLLDGVDLDKDVAVTKSTVSTILQMRRKLEAQGIVFGDRRWVKALRVVRAYALVSGSLIADSMELNILTSVLWDKEEQVSEVAQLVRKVSAPRVQKAREIYDAVMDEIGGGDFGERTTDELTSLLPKLKTAYQRIKKQEEQATEGREQKEVNGLRKSVGEDFQRARATLKDRYGLDDEVS